VCLPLAALQQYILANAAVSRSFSAYFAALIGKPTNFFTIAHNDYTVDFLAAGLMIACGILLTFSTAGGSLFNTIVTGQCQAQVHFVQVLFLQPFQGLPLVGS
jgi:hypothetical protein